MADMSDVKNRSKNILTVNGEEVTVIAEKSDHVVCVFHLDNLNDVEAVGGALKKNFLVLLDITACDEERAHRARGFTKGVVYPMQVWTQGMSENILVYLPDSYQIREFQN